MPEFEKLADSVFAAVEGYLAKAIGGITARMDALDKRIKEVRAVRGEKGLQGDRGERGDPGLKGDRGDPGSPGPTILDVTKACDERIAAIPAGPKGDRGERGEEGEPGVGVVGLPGAVGPAGERGAQGEPGPKGDIGPSGKDGARGEIGEPGTKGIDGRDGKDARDGKDGAPGRDATEIEPLASIDPTRSYARGTHALYAGGEIRAFRNTDPIPEGGPIERAGWTVTRDGIRQVEIEHGGPGEATFRIVLTSGKATETNFNIPRVLYRGVYREGVAYGLGDMVTYGGSTWHCNGELTGAPGVDHKGWTLAVKKGVDGKEGRGERGPEGKAGRVTLGFGGEKH